MSEITVRRRKPGFLGFLGRHKQAVAIVLLVAGTGAYAAYALWPEKSSTTYATSAAQTGTLTVAVSATGNTAAAKSSTVNPSISGTVAGLKVGLGDSVKAGQVLFKVVNDDLDAAIDRAYSSYVQAKGQVEQATLSLLEVKQSLYNLQHPTATSSTTTGGGGQTSTTASTPTAADIAIAKQKVVIAQNGVTSAKASRTSALVAYEQAKDTAALRTVKAPIAGVITSLNVQDGDQLGSASSSGGSTAGGTSSGSSSPIVLTDLSSIRGEVSVNEVDYPNLKVGQKATMTFDAISDLSITGKVVAIDQIGTNTQGVVTYNVRISFDVQDERVRPGMTCSASITTSVKPDVVLVPNAAVKSNASGSYVLVMATSSTTPQQVTVEVGDANDTYTEITSGVTAGQKVVTQTITAGSTSSASSTSNSSSFRGAGMMLGGGGGPGGD